MCITVKFEVGRRAPCPCLSLLSSVLLLYKYIASGIRSLLLASFCEQQKFDTKPKMNLPGFEARPKALQAHACHATHPH